MRIAIPAVVTLAIVTGCANAPFAGIRFRNQPPVWRVNDRTNVATSPADRKYYRAYYHVDSFIVRRLTRVLDVPAPSRALDINSVDEVPDSTWFTNRIGVRVLSLDELRRGPNRDPNPVESLPWKITGAKVGGTSVGFVIEDSKGDKYLMKFDARSAPELETGAHIIAHRIAWACGYNVPEDYVGYIRRTDLVIPAGAHKKDVLGHKTTLTADDLDRILATVAHADDGTIRVLASRYLPGKPIGPYAREGTRSDDPNDLIPHERRRSVRGQVPIFSWLNHTDMQEDNSLDSYGGDSETHYVTHYLIDFGKSLGVMGLLGGWNTIGYTFRVDAGKALVSLLGLGLVDRDWDHVSAPTLRGIGLYESANYHPGSWRENAPYWPHLDKDTADAFWGAKILIRFTREQLAAIVGEARFTDPRATEYMTRILVERQRITARYWFGKIAPLDDFTIEPDGDGARVCFDDLMVSYGLADVAAGTRYHADAVDYDGRSTGWSRTARADRRGKACFDGLVPPTSHAGYTVVRIRLQRSARFLPTMYVHLARGDAGALRLVGLRRE